MLISFLIVLLIIFTASVPAAAQYGDSGSFQTSEGCICGVIIFVIIIAVILIYYPMKKDQDAKKAREYYYPGTAPRAVETSKPWWLMSSSEYQNYIRQQRKQLHGNNQKPPWLGQSGSKPIDLDAYDELADEPETEVETETEAPAMVVQEMKGEQRSARKKKKLRRGHALSSRP